MWKKIENASVAEDAFSSKFSWKRRVWALVAEMSLLRTVRGGSLFGKLHISQTEKIEGMKLGVVHNFTFCEATPGF